MSLEILKKFTPARINLEKSGSALKTQELLKLKEALARAHDAVLEPWHYQKLQEKLEQQNYATLELNSCVNTRIEYLQRPDLGRILSASSQKLLTNYQHNFDIVIIISDGLSSSAVDNHAINFLLEIKSLLKASHYSYAPLCLVPFSRVALSDEIGFRLKAKLALMIIGERPGLSSWDSLGVYLTYNPHPGAHDADRNCISNIHPPEGLSYELAAHKLAYLINESFRLKLSGIKLKEDATGLKNLKSRAILL